MVNSLNIEFSQGALSVLSNQTDNKQDAILAAILKAASKDLSMLTKQSLAYVTESDIYILDIDSKWSVIFKHIESKIHIVDIINSEMMDTSKEQVPEGGYKKFNIQEMMQAFNELTQMGTFNHIEDPFELQSQLRDEWESRY